MNLYVQESFVKATEGYHFGESDVYETYTDDAGELYRDMVREYGRCIGKVYVDRDDGGQIHVGWIFQKRDRYEDTGETYLREVWVTVHEEPDTVTRTRHYRALDRRQS